MAEPQTASRQGQHWWDFAEGVGKFATGVVATVGAVAAVTWKYGKAGAAFLGRAIPVVGGIYGAYQAGTDAGHSFANGNWWRGGISLTEALLYTTAAAGVILAPVTGGASLAVVGPAIYSAMAITASKAVYDNADTLRGMVGWDLSYHNPKLTTMVAGLPSPDLAHSPEFAFMNDPNGNFERLVKLCANDKFINQEVVDALAALSPLQQAYLLADPAKQEATRKVMSETVAAAADKLRLPQNIETLSRNDAFQGDRFKAIFGGDEAARMKALQSMSIDDIFAIRKAIKDLPSPATAPQDAVPRAQGQRAEIAPSLVPAVANGSVAGLRVTGVDTEALPASEAARANMPAATAVVKPPQEIRVSASGGAAP